MKIFNLELNNHELEYLKGLLNQFPRQETMEILKQIEEQEELSKGVK